MCVSLGCGLMNDAGYVRYKVKSIIVIIHVSGAPVMLSGRHVPGGKWAWPVTASRGTSQCASLLLLLQTSAVLFKFITLYIFF